MATSKGYRKGSRGKGTRARRDVYQEVTDRMVEALERGVAPWVRPWRTLGGAAGNPRNAVSGKEYRGVNVWLLSLESARQGWTDSRFVTFRQAKQLGGSVRKGERGTLVVFWRRFEVTDTDPATGEETRKQIPMLRHYHVFNAEQCDGLELDVPTSEPLPEVERDEACEVFLGLSGADIRHGGSRAFYRHEPADYIQLPRAEQFSDMGAYYATAFHELVHWTGASTRLGRTKGGRFGDEAYAFEELVAELGSAFLSQRFELDGKLQHPEYLASWLKALKGDKRFIFTASSHARRACEYLDEVESRELVSA